MPTKPESEPGEVKITANGAEFYSLVRAMKRAYRASDLGEVVMFATGSSARQTEVTDKRPCDAVVMAIVDEWELQGTSKYRKTPADGEWAS